MTRDVFYPNMSPMIKKTTIINVGIAGATGLAGEELIKVLLRHPGARITHLCAKIDKPRHIAEIFPVLKERLDLICYQPNAKELASKCDLVFLALPHTVSMTMAPALLKAGKSVIDLSADYRLSDPRVYRKFYNVEHKDKKNLKRAVYGLCELNRNKIRSAGFIANPGCYPTAAILAIAPLAALNLVEPSSVIIDAKSGASGAGRKVSEALLFGEVNEDFKAYKVNVHQHMPEISQELSGLAGERVKVIFIPHLLPLERGILETIYAKKGKRLLSKKRDLHKLYKNFYKKEPFIRIKEEGEFPRLKDVSRTNFCDIAIKDEGDSIIIIAAIDNLLKGAAGQAVQNMNIMYNLPEHLGLL